jgi:chromosome segregation ATPase
MGSMNNKNSLVFGLLFIGATITGCQSAIDKHKTDDSDTIASLENNYSIQDSTRNAVQADYNYALARLDSLAGSNIQLTGQQITTKNEIDSLKSQIRTELSQKRADLNKTTQLVAQLKSKIAALFNQVNSPGKPK